MCGIHGLLSLSGRTPPDAALHARMGGVTAHRGPDDHGYYLDGEMLLGMRRLSIIDLAGGHQPIANEDGRIHIVVNGEFYDFERQRRDLERRGHVFRTRSDSEIALHLYEEFGAHCVQHLRGEFAFAVWDEKNQTLFAARDRSKLPNWRCGTISPDHRPCQPCQRPDEYIRRSPELSDRRPVRYSD